MNILKIENLKKVYGSGETEVKALDDISFQVEEGEFNRTFWKWKINIVTFNCRARKANKWKCVFL